MENTKHLKNDHYFKNNLNKKNLEFLIFFLLLFQGGADNTEIACVLTDSQYQHVAAVLFFLVWLTTMLYFKVGTIKTLHSFFWCVDKDLFPVGKEHELVIF